MPTYEYACDACEHQWEAEQRISEAPIKKCPKCGKQKAHRLISQGNFVLKGGGWYSDLYSKPSGTTSSSSPKAEKSSSKSSDATTPIKTDAKKPSSNE